MAGRIGGTGEPKRFEYTRVTKDLTRFQKMQESFFSSNFYKVISKLFSSSVPTQEAKSEELAAFKSKVFVDHSPSLRYSSRQFELLKEKIETADVFELDELRAILTSMQEDLRVLSYARSVFPGIAQEAQDMSDYEKYTETLDRLSNQLNTKIQDLTDVKKAMLSVLPDLIRYCDGGKVDETALYSKLVDLKHKKAGVFNQIAIRLEEKYTHSPKERVRLNEMYERVRVEPEKQKALLLDEIKKFTPDREIQLILSKLVQYCLGEPVDKEKLVGALYNLRQSDRPLFDLIFSSSFEAGRKELSPLEKFFADNDEVFDLKFQVEAKAHNIESREKLLYTFTPIEGSKEKIKSREHFDVRTNLLKYSFGEPVDTQKLIQDLSQLKPEARETIFKDFIESYPTGAAANLYLIEQENRVLHIQARVENPSYDAALREIETLRFPGFEKTPGLPSLIEGAPSIFRDIIRGDSTVGKDNSAAKLLSPLVIHKDALKTLVDFWEKHPNQEKISGFSDIQVKAIKSVVGELEVASASQLQKLFQSNPFLFLTGPQLASFREHLHGIEQPPAISKQNEQILGLLVLQLPQFMARYSELTPQQKVVVDALIETLQKKVPNSESLDSFQTELVKLAPMIGKGVQDLRNSGFVESLQMALRHPGRLQRPRLLFVDVADYANRPTGTNNPEALISNLSVLKSYNPNLYKKSMDELVQRFSKNTEAKARLLELDACVTRGVSLEQLRKENKEVYDRATPDKIAESMSEYQVVQSINDALEEQTGPQEHHEFYKPLKILRTLHQDGARDRGKLYYYFQGKAYTPLSFSTPGRSISEGADDYVRDVYSEIQRRVGEGNEQWLETVQFALTQGVTSGIKGALTVGLLGENLGLGKTNYNLIATTSEGAVTNIVIRKGADGKIETVTAEVYMDVEVTRAQGDAEYFVGPPIKAKISIEFKVNPETKKIEAQPILAKNITISDRPELKGLPKDLKGLKV